MSLHAPPTGIAAFDAALWVNPPPRTRGLQLGSGVKLVQILPDSAAPKSWEAEIAPTVDHLVMWRRGARAPVDVRIADRRDPVSPHRRRNGFLVPAGAASRWVGRDMVPSVSLHLHLPAAWLADIAEESDLPGAAAQLSPRLGLPERRLAPLFAGLLAAWAEDTEPPRSTLEHWALLLGCALLPRPRARRPGALDAATLGRVRDFLSANLHRDIGLAEMAAIPDMPRRSFVAAFRAATGEAPHDHLARLRLERANALIASMPLPLADVALLAGFRDAGHLRTTLRRHGRGTA